MSKYKVQPYRDGFKVWTRINVGNGWMWDDVNRFFRTKEDADRFIKEQKEGEKK